MGEALGFSGFSAVNWFFTLVTAAILTWIYAYHRFLFVKPSMQLLGYSHLFFQWPLSVYSRHFESFLPDPYALLFLVHSYELVGLLISVQTLHSSATVVWNRVTVDSLHSNNRAVDFLLFLLGTLLTFGIVVYLFYVPITATGLYAVLFTPELASIARENGLKLLGSPVPKFAFSFATFAVAPLVAALLAIRLVDSFSECSWGRFMGSLLALAALTIIVSLSGARSGPVNMVVLIFLVFLWRRKLTFPLWGWLGMITLVLSSAILMTLFREGRGLSAAGDLVLNIVSRVLFVPLEVGVWYLDYTQTYGLFGPAAIPKLAWLLGLEPINASNIIGLEYAFQPLESISATSGYLFSYYSYFGPLGLVLSLIGLWCLDLATLVIARIPVPLVLPCLAATTLVALLFVQSDYTVVWLTHGFGLIVILGYVAGKMLPQAMRKLPSWLPDSK